jgi:predicted RNase H-like nuclease
MPLRWAVAGIDLAWGERRPDGLCLLRGRGQRVVGVSYSLPRGDEELLAHLRVNLPPREAALLCLDAPVVCPNRRGARPVDRLTHRVFHRAQAAAHPANRVLAARPLRVVRRLRTAGYDISAGWPSAPRALVEVFPHPATVRWFGLDRTIKYKRGPAAARRREFARLQRLLRAWLADRAPDLARDPGTVALLRRPWTKDTEDLTDALLCALVGWQWAVRGRRSMEILGDLRTGFIVVPRATKVGKLSPAPHPA